jgi:hypothetical protein
MALEGTLKDFGLADIFQLIGIQRKTGVLTLKNETDVVTVSFLNGNVVSADSLHKNLEDRLGTVLVKSGHVTQQHLQDALRIQKNTLQRLGFVLVNEKFISQAGLREALTLQVTQIVYRLFRWQDGYYHFSQEESLNYDREYFTPIPAQNVLMEGIRMIDEWPLIERKIRSFDMVFEPAHAGLLVEEVADEAALGEAKRPGSEPPSDGKLRLEREHAHVYRLLDGRITVQDLIDRTRMGEFDTCRNLYELLERGAIREVRALHPLSKKEKAVTARGRSELLGIGYAVVLVAAAISVATLQRNPLNLVPRTLDESPTVDAFRRLISKNRIERVDHALYLYFLKHQRFAPSLTQLVEEALLPPGAVSDPWGRFYLYEVQPSGYRIVGYDNGGVEDPTLARERHFPTGLLPSESRQGGRPT